MMMRIFVSIASYRDTELGPTIEDLLAKAARPENLRIGVFNQISDADDDCLPPSMAQVDEIRVDASESRGVCWARAELYKRLLRDEDYVLQIDSHMRFEPDWDERLFKQLAACDNACALVTTYPTAYQPPDRFASKYITVLKPGQFNENGVLVYQSDTYPMDKKPSAPISSAFVSANFLFGPCEAFRTVPYDPYLYFFGEEVTLSARLWTHGWDFYAPNEVLLYHDYTNGRDRPRHWHDHSSSERLDELSVQRIHYLLSGESVKDTEALQDITDYQLGDARRFADYEAFAKVDFRQQKIRQTRYVIRGKTYHMVKS